MRTCLARPKAGRIFTSDNRPSPTTATPSRRDKGSGSAAWPTASLGLLKGRQGHALVADDAGEVPRLGDREGLGAGRRGAADKAAPGKPVVRFRLHGRLTLHVKGRSSESHRQAVHSRCKNGTSRIDRMGQGRRDPGQHGDRLIGNPPARRPAHVRHEFNPDGLIKIGQHGGVEHRYRRLSRGIAHDFGSVPRLGGAGYRW